MYYHAKGKIESSEDRTPSVARAAAWGATADQVGDTSFQEGVVYLSEDQLVFGTADQYPSWIERINAIWRQITAHFPGHPYHIDDDRAEREGLEQTPDHVIWVIPYPAIADISHNDSLRYPEIRIRTHTSDSETYRIQALHGDEQANEITTKIQQRIVSQGTPG